MLTVIVGTVPAFEGPISFGTANFHAGFHADGREGAVPTFDRSIP